MKNLYFLICIALIGFSTNAQVFDNVNTYSVNVNPLWPHNQVQVITPSTGDYYYELYPVYMYQGAVVTKFDPSGAVVWAKQIKISGGVLHHYMSFCFNTNEDEIALVGTAFYTGNKRPIISRIDPSTGAMISSMTYSHIDYEAWGTSIRPYNSGYVIAGELEEFSQANKRMFLAEVDNTLNLSWSYFFKDANNSVSEIYRDMAIYGNEATIIGVRNNQEIKALHFDLSTQTLNYNYGGSFNTVGLAYSQTIETPPHFIIEGGNADDPQSPKIYVGAGLLTSSSSINILFAQLNYADFAVQWSDQYIDPAGPSNQVWSPGRLKLEDDMLVSSFQTGNSTLPDNGIIHVDKNNGTWMNGFSYNNWGYAALHEVNSVSGSTTFMTGRGMTMLHYFDGDGFGVNNIGCGNYPRNFTMTPATPAYNLYEYNKHLAFTQISVGNSPQNVTGTTTDCSGMPIGSFKKSTVGMDENANAQASFRVFPNPVSGDQLQVKLTDEVIAVELVDLQGRVVTSVANPGLNLTLDISAVPNGLYILRMRDQEKVSSVQIHRL